MGNYHYIIVGLPVLSKDFGNQDFLYEETVSAIREQLSPIDNRKIDWLEFGLDSNNLSVHFYHAASKCKSSFITGYFEFDRKIRNSMVNIIASRNNIDAGKYTMGDIDTDFDEYPEIIQIMEIPNIIEREFRIDRLKWNKITSLVDFHYFDMDVILGFIAKGKIVDRWLKMDKNKGAVLFEQFVQEVRGTFKGTEFNKENKN